MPPASGNDATSGPLGLFPERPRTEQAAASTVHDEAARLLALAELEILDTAPEAEFDALVEAAALACDAPVAFLSLVDAERQWFKASIGLADLTELPRKNSFCTRTILDDVLFEVPDIAADPRFADNVLNEHDPAARFYAGMPLRLADGSRVGALCVVDRRPRQLTERQREILQRLGRAAAAALQQRRSARALHGGYLQYRTLAEASPLGVFATDPDGACTFTNSRWQKIFELDASQSLGDAWSRVVHPDDREAVYLAWLEAANLNQEFEQPIRLVTASGRERHVRTRARAVLDAAGEVRGFVGTVEDVTDKIAAAAALERERARLSNILEGTGAGTWEWNVQTGETRFNQRWAEMIGYSLDQLEPVSIDTWAAHSHPDDLGRSVDALQKHFAGETDAYECRARMRHRDGHWIWVLDRGRVLSRTQAGEPERMFGTHIDITERMQQTEALAMKERLLQRTGNLAGVGGWEFDCEQDAVTLSDQVCAILEREAGILLSLDQITELHVPKGAGQLRQAFARALSDGESFDMELPFVTASGREIWVNLVGAADYAVREPSRIVGAFQDITDIVAQRQAIAAAKERLELATASGGVGVWEYLIETGQVTWEGSMRTLYGIDLSEASEDLQWWLAKIHPEDRQRVEGEFERAVAANETFSSQYRIVQPDESVRYLQAVGRIKRDGDGSTYSIMGTSVDVTQIHNLTAELQVEHELLQVTMQSIGDAVITADAAGRITWLNPAAEQLTGWSNAEALGVQSGQVFNIIDEESREPAENPVARCLDLGATVALEDSTVLIGRQGNEYGIEDSAAPIRTAGGATLGAVLVFRDVSEQRRLNTEMHYRARHDPLTGLVNRAEFETRLARAAQRPLDGDGAHALMCIDLDQFKLVNDSCGHAAGDTLLQQVSRILQDAVRARDTVARLGGDEFGILLENCPGAQAQRLARNICDRIDDFRFHHGGRPFRVGASIGLVELDSRWPDTAAAMQAADSACLAAKEAGRNRVHVWCDTAQALSARSGEARWLPRIEAALDHDSFDLYVQRMVGFDDAPEALHGEVLLRLTDTAGDPILPGAFMPAVARHHLAARLDGWVLQQTIARLSGLVDTTRIETLSINISGPSVSDRAFHEQAIAMLTAAGPAVCRRLCLECSETAAVTNLADATRLIGQVRALGVRFALDDFGAGGSSFGYLKSLKVDLIKIDGRFVEGLDDDPLDAAAIRSFVDVAAVVGVKTVAKAVERPETYQRLRRLGVDYVQGYLLHSPCPLDLFGQRFEGTPAVKKLAVL